MTSTTTTPTRYAFPFEESESPLKARMARGHLARTGHELAGYYVFVDGTSTVVSLVRTCCGETPERSD